MSITAAARAEHETLFPDHVSTLAQSDPDLIEIFDNLTFDDLVRDAPLARTTRLMVQCAALIAGGSVAEYRTMAGAALNVGVTPVELKEVVYQAVPYAGMGRVFDVLHATNELLIERGLELPLPSQATTTRENRLEVGRGVQEQIVGTDRVAAMYDSSPPDQLHLQRYLSANCFGDHVTRSGLDLATRELLTLAMLTALGGADAQLAAHVSANLNVGNDRATLIAVATHLLPFVGYPRTLNAINAINQNSTYEETN